MKSKIAIFSILDSPGFGGGEQYLLSNLEFLSQQGFSIYLATFNHQISTNYKKQFSIINLPFRLDLIGNLRGAVKFFFQAPLAIIWVIEILSDLNKKFDQVIVYTPGFTERLVFSPFFKLLGLKIIWLEYGPVAAVFKRNFGLPKIIYFLASSFPDQVATISQHSRASLLANTSVSHNKISTIYPGTPCITDKKLKLIKKRGRTWKKNQRLGLKKLITFVGRLTVEKEVDVLLKAFAKLKQKNLQLIIIGTGPEKIIYQNLAKKLKINDRVTFTGFVSETNKTAILAVSEVFVFPSAWEMEGFGITTIEAMMAGIPIITTGAGPQQEIVIDKKTGLFFNPHHPDDLCQKINLLLLNSDLAQKLGRRGRKIALKKFEQTHMQQQTLDLIQSLCV